jgi:hypothetical protein
MESARRHTGNKHAAVGGRGGPLIAKVVCNHSDLLCAGHRPLPSLSKDHMMRVVSDGKKLLTATNHALTEGTISSAAGDRSNHPTM